MVTQGPSPTSLNSYDYQYRVNCLHDTWRFLSSLVPQLFCWNTKSIKTLIEKETPNIPTLFSCSDVNGSSTQTQEFPNASWLCRNASLQTGPGRCWTRTHDFQVHTEIGLSCPRRTNRRVKLTLYVCSSLKCMKLIHVRSSSREYCTAISALGTSVGQTMVKVY